MAETRYFVSRPTEPSGEPAPVLASPPDYYRVARDRAYLWTGDGWELLFLPLWPDVLDDLLASGATVREVLDTAELPEGADRG